MIFIKTARSVISDHLKNSANIKKLKVGSEILKIKGLEWDILELSIDDAGATIIEGTN